MFQMSAVICIGFLSNKWMHSKEQAAFSIDRKRIPRPPTQRIVNMQWIRIARGDNIKTTLYMSTSVCIEKDSTHLVAASDTSRLEIVFQTLLFALQVMWKDSICHYMGCQAFIFTIDIPWKIVLSWPTACNKSIIIALCAVVTAMNISSGISASWCASYCSSCRCGY